jgi:hypothetical protein
LFFNPETKIQIKHTPAACIAVRLPCSRVAWASALRLWEAAWRRLSSQLSGLAAAS